MSVDNSGACAMRIGACYYPEHWEPARWAVDARMMRAAGFNLIRTGEFAWVQCEPSPGEFAWEWLDRALDVFAAQDIDVVLGTPTAAPPAWLMRAHPEIGPTRADGRRVQFGGRRHYCPNQPAFREATARVVRAMGEHYAAHPRVIGWQIDNEYGGAFHGGMCYCAACERAFQDWLRRRYQTLDALNAAWGLDFWSMRMGAWEEIPAPRETGGPHNPSLLLAWRRFYTDVWCDYQRLQADLLRAAGVTTPLTTNLMGLSWGFDPHTMGKCLDVVSWDNYPICARDAHGYATPALACDFMRAVNGGKPYWVTEQQSGAGGQGTIFGRTEPGQMRMWAYQALAHGADTLLFFRWRSCPFGAEQYWHGILQHDGRPNWRLEEATQLATELHALPADLFTARTPAQAGVFLSAQAAWSHELQGHVKGFSYKEEVLRPYKALRRAALDVDALYEGSDLSPYRLIVAPACQLMTPELAERLTDFVHGGGTLVVTFRSAVKNWEGVIFSEPLPGPLRALLGVTIDDTDAVGAQDESVAVAVEHPLFGRMTTTGSLWADVLTADTAETVATFADIWYAGRPAITRRRHGAGTAWYVATQFDEPFWQRLMAVLLTDAGLASEISVSDGVECTRREGQQRYTFLANTLNTPGWAETRHPYRDLLTQAIHQPGRLILTPFSVSVLVAQG
jgi:beta-galactosidase